MEWLTSQDQLFTANQVKATFKLTSRPLAEVYLELHCEGIEVMIEAAWQHPEKTLPGTQGKGITIKPSDWQTEHTLVLRFTGTENLEGGALEKSGTFVCSSSRSHKRLFNRVFTRHISFVPSFSQSSIIIHDVSQPMPVRASKGS